MAAVAAGAEVIDPRPWAAPAIREIFAAYPHIGKVLPAVGYDAAQLAALAATINKASVDVVVSATPADLMHLVEIDKPVVRARYEYAETEGPRLSSIIDAFIERMPTVGGRR